MSVAVVLCAFLVGACLAQNCALPGGNWVMSCTQANMLGSCVVNGVEVCLLNAMCGTTHNTNVATSFQYNLVGMPPQLQNINGVFKDQNGNNGAPNAGTLPCPNVSRLKVHVIAHSHDDVGWDWTVDDYYQGCRPGDKTGVNGIITTVVQALQANPTRKFNQVEFAYFTRWWNAQSTATQAVVKQLVAEGRLDFINGGWSMNDEACVHHRSVIENMQLGNQFVRENFNGKRIRAGWHIDPFGHTGSMARMMAQMGFDAFFFCGTRIDFSDRDQMAANRSLEHVWFPSPSLGNGNYLLNAISKDHYNNGCFDACVSGYCCCPWNSDDPFDNTTSVPSAGPVVRRANATNEDVQYIYQFAQSIRHPVLWMMFGDDFQFQNAEDNFVRMEAVMAGVNSSPNAGIDMFYSTPGAWIDAVNAIDVAFPTDVLDYMPMVPVPHDFWAGFYTSRSAFKGYERVAMSELLAAEMLHTMHPTSNVVANMALIEKFRELMGVAQHHDAITGTERQKVCDNYLLMIQAARVGAEVATTSLVGSITGLANVATCPLANISACASTENLDKAPVSIALHNPLAWVRSEFVSVPVPVQGVTVKDYQGNTVPCQVIANARVVLDPDLTSPTTLKHQPYMLIFNATVPPLGITTYTIQSGSDDSFARSERARGDTVIENDFYQVTISGTSGKISSVLNKASGVTTPLTQDILWYCPAVKSPVSGAYTFRTCNATETGTRFTDAATVVVTRGALFQQVEQQFDDLSHVNQIVRLYNGQNYITLITGVGEIDVTLGGKEIFTRFTTGFPTAGTWYTDAQGLEVYKRVYNFRPTFQFTQTEPIAGNFFPMNAFTTLLSKNGNTSFLFVTDRSRASGSLAEGELELVYHRRLLHDDGAGVGEALDEVTRIITTNLVTVGDTPDATQTLRRRLAALHAYPLQVFYGTGKASAPWAPIAAPLPPNVQVLAMETNPDMTVTLRLFHLYLAGESSTLSVPVSVDVATLFPGRTISNMVEYDLNSATPLANITRLTWKTTNNAVQTPPAPEAGVRGTVVTLNPMDIRTFRVSLA